MASAPLAATAGAGGSNASRSATRTALSLCAAAAVAFAEISTTSVRSEVASGPTTVVPLTFRPVPADPEVPTDRAVPVWIDLT